MGRRLWSSRILMLILGILALLFAIKLNQAETVKEFLSKFVKYELAGYKE